MFKRAGNMIGFAFKTLWLSSGFLPQASPQTESEPSPADQHDHGRAARHVPQRAGHVALPACHSLSLRGHQPSQEAGMRLALSLPQGSRT